MVGWHALRRNRLKRGQKPGGLVMFIPDIKVGRVDMGCGG